MDDIQKASMKRLRNTYADAGFVLRTEDGMQAPVRLWFYSCTLDANGKISTRMVAQASSELYQSMRTRTGIMANHDISPVDALACCLNDFDGKRGKETEADRQILTAVMAHYALLTDTWKQAPEISQIPGIHFLVMDWTPGHSALKSMRPAMMLAKDSILTSPELQGFAEYVMNSHFKLRPDDRPKKP